MATPDLSTLTSSAQIFTSNTYTLPQIRAIHNQLHNAIDDKSARLRTQVGSSYRELLGTADKIVKMRADMDDLQRVLGSMGSRCGRGVVNGKVQKLGEFVRACDVGDDEDEEPSKNAMERYTIAPHPSREARGLRAAAMQKLLDACVLAAAKLLGARSSPATGSEPNRSRTAGLVTAAKVLILGKQLIDRLETCQRSGLGSENAGRLLESSRFGLARLRRQLLRRIDSTLAENGDEGDQAATLGALTAWTVTHESNARGALDHLLKVRKVAINSAPDADAKTHNSKHGSIDAVRPLRLYVQTLLDIQYLVPSRLTTSFAQLGKTTLLHDPALQEIETLRLDVYGHLCHDDIQELTVATATGDEIDGHAAKGLLFRWAEEGGISMLYALQTAFQQASDLSTVIDRRTDVLQTWLHESGHVRGFDASPMMYKLRQTIKERLIELIEAKAGKLRIIGSEIDASLQIWQEGAAGQRQSLWVIETFDLDMDNGANHLALEINARLYGRNAAVSRVITGYESWLKVVEEADGTIEKLKKQRWDNDVDEIEAEETIEQRQRMLSKDDPQELQELLRRTLRQNLKHLDEHLMDLWTNATESSNAGHIAMYLLRILRDIGSRLPPHADVQRFGVALVPQLHQTLATTLAQPLLESFAASYWSTKRVVGRRLWNGEPELPVSPSAGVSRLLRDIVTAMDRAGADLWSPSAVLSLKKHIGSGLSRRWPANAGQEVVLEDEEAVEKQSDQTDGKADDSEENSVTMTLTDNASTAPSSTDLAIQQYLDVCVLRNYLGENLDEIEDKQWQETQLDDSSARERMSKSARDYFTRSNLLFGLLL